MAELLNIVIPYIPSAALPIVICACFYMYIQSKRKETAVERNKDSQNLHDNLLKLQFEVDSLKHADVHKEELLADLQTQCSTLNSQLAVLSVKLDTLVEAIKELKQ